MAILKAIFFLIRAFLLPRLILAAENLALRQQVAVYRHAPTRTLAILAQTLWQARGIAGLASSTDGDPGNARHVENI